LSNARTAGDARGDAADRVYAGLGGPSTSVAQHAVGDGKPASVEPAHGRDGTDRLEHDVGLKQLA